MISQKPGRQSRIETDLDRIKAARIRSIEIGDGAVPLLRRGIRRYRQLSAAYPQHAVIYYFVGRVIHWGKILVVAKIISILGVLRRMRPKRLARVVAPSGPLRYGIRITGGLGDALIVARLARDIQAEIKCQAEFDVYFHSPKAIEPFFEGLNGFRESIHVEAFVSAAPYYDFAIIANQFVTFANQSLNLSTLTKIAPKVLSFFGSVEAARKGIEKYIAVHPALDGAFADLAVRKGCRRVTYLHEMMGIPYGGDRLDIPVDISMPSKVGLKAGGYITVHDGWDTKFKMLSDRPMKALPLDSWAQIVAEIKALRPDLQIVQLGGKTGSDIPGADVNLKNQLTFLESVSVLAHSRLHLDTESGLVHVGASLGVRSVVLFGPTNVDWFGYPQNINIAPRQCGNCWWSTDSWMDVCAAGHDVPVCTSAASIAPAEVALRAVAALDEQPAQKRPVTPIYTETSHAC